MKKSIKKIIVASIIPLFIFYMIGGFNLITLGYVSVNGTQTTGEIIKVKDTWTSVNERDVYKIYIEYETQDGKIVRSSFKKSLSVYDSNTLRVGRSIPIKYSNFTPQVMVYIGSSTGD